MNALAWAGSLARDLAAFALPQRCPGCGGRALAETLLCDSCLRRIPRLATPLCVRCLVTGQSPVGCLTHRGLAAHAAWIYDERAALVVHALKYAERPGLAAVMGERMAAALPAGYRPDLVLEVPLHRTRRRERGYNQASVLADAVAAVLAAPRWPDALVRTRATRAQARLDAGARRANVAGAFQARQSAALAGRSVLIVDDVLTTGATLEACLTTLRAARADARAATLAWAQ